MQPNWLIQTPNIWGQAISVYNQSYTPQKGEQLDKDFYMPTCTASKSCLGIGTCSTPIYTLDINGHKKQLCTTPADTILNKLYESIINANHSVDILTLQPGHIIESSITTGAFTAALKNALIALAKKTITTGQPINVRLLQGSFLPITLKNDAEGLIAQQQARTNLQLSQQTYLKNLVNALPKNNHLSISIGSMRSCQRGIVNCGNYNHQHDPFLAFAWNHGKIIDIDRAC